MFLWLYVFMRPKASAVERIGYKVVIKKELHPMGDAAPDSCGAGLRPVIQEVPDRGKGHLILGCMALNQLG